jgi:hypothetical protein
MIILIAKQSTLFCPDALVALRTGRQTIADGLRPCEALRLRPPSPTTVTDRETKLTGIFDIVQIKGSAHLDQLLETCGLMCGQQHQP